MKFRSPHGGGEIFESRAAWLCWMRRPSKHSNLSTCEFWTRWRTEVRETSSSWWSNESRKLYFFEPEY